MPPIDVSYSIALRRFNVFSPDGLPLVRNVSVYMPRGSVVGIWGESGSGKTSFINALIGHFPSSGRVIVDGRPVTLAELGDVLSVIPQHDLLRKKLSVGRALELEAKLRMPRGTPQSDRMDRIQEILELLNLEHLVERTIDPLAGGEKKRLAIAIELLAKPDILIADEPTNHLDQTNARKVMRGFRDLALDGVTSFVITHDPRILESCDHILLLGHGRQLAYGTPEEVLAFMGVDNWYQLPELSTNDCDDIADRYSQSDLAKSYRPPETAFLIEPRKGRNADRRPADGIRQWWTLCGLFIEELKCARWELVWMVVQPIAMALLLIVVFPESMFAIEGSEASGDGNYAQARMVLFFITVAQIYFSAFNAVPQLVRERALYVRLREIAVDVGPYLASKLVILLAVGGAQSLIFVAILLYGGASLSTLPVLWIALASGALAGTVMGLLISAYAPSETSAAMLLPFAMLPQILLAGVLRDLSGVQIADLQVASILSTLTPARYVFDALAVGGHLSAISDAPAVVPYQHQTPAQVHLAALGVLTVVGLGLAATRLAVQKRES